MIALRDCVALAEAGPKAQRLARGLVLGLPVPDAVVVLPSEPLPSLVDLQGVLEGLRQSPWESSTRYVVRSSALAEDLAGQSAAGLFLSVVGVPLEEVAAAIEQVRTSGETALVKMALGHSIPVAVIIQRQVEAARLGVLYRSQHGDLRCEERDASAPEWTDVTVSRYGPEEVNPLVALAGQLVTLLSSEQPGHGPSALYAEYAVSSLGKPIFLQVRPAPIQRQPSGFALPDDDQSAYALDQEHNPDPLSAAQQGLVEAVADLVPWLRQRAVQGYLYFAQATGKKPPVMQSQTREVFTTTILPSCEAMLGPAERRLLGKDGALRSEILEDPSRCELSLADSLAVYRSIYNQYVGLLGPAIKQARNQIDQLLRANLGETLNQHGALLAGIGGAQTERISSLWELGRLGCPPLLLRRFLARFGAFSSCWDVLFPCDDERPQSVIEYAQHLAGLPQTPEEQHEAALACYHDAQRKLLSRLPRMARGALQTLLPLLRDAMLVAEDDDVLFFRAQRLVRWALVSRGVKLHRAGRLSDPGLVFDLAWRPYRGGSDPLDHPESLDLDALAQKQREQRLFCRQLVPPQRIVQGQPEWALPDGRTLSGTGVFVGKQVVSGRALVVSSLDDPSASMPQVLSKLTADTILVMPTLLPSWAPAVWGALAVVTDSGGALSHGAILARERGIPAVLGTRLATRLIANGQPLLVDSDRGLVVLSPSPASKPSA